VLFRSTNISLTVVFLCKVLRIYFQNLLEMLMLITIINIFDTIISLKMYHIDINNHLDRTVV